MKFLLRVGGIVLIVFCIQFQAYSQKKYSSGVGVGVNLSKFYLAKSQVEYPDPMSAEMGFNVRFNGEYYIKKNIGINLEGGLSYMNSKALKKNDRKSITLDFPLYISYRTPVKLDVNVGILYQYLLRFSTNNGSRGNIDLTSITTNRNFINPYIGLSYNVTDMISFNMEAVFSLKETYMAATEDYNGVLVFDLPARRHFIGLAIWFKM